jgi:hypothetical protein
MPEAEDQIVSRTSFPYGVGFRSLTRETPTPVPLPVQGELPSWLAGPPLRTGPSKFEVGNRTYNGSTAWRCCIASLSCKAA